MLTPLFRSADATTPGGAVFAHRGAGPASLRIPLSPAAMRRGWCGFLLALCSGIAPVSGQALAQRAAVDADPQDWPPDVILGTTPWIPDPAYLDGVYGVDRFAGPNNADYQGRAAVRLPNGDTVTVGLVAHPGNGNPANGLWNIGLVRYNAAGQRVAWSNPGAYGYFGNQYIAYPFSTTPFYQYVRDIKYLNGYLYVLADYQNQSTGGPAGQDVHVLVFNQSGAFVDDWFAFGWFDNPGNAHYGATLVPLSDDRLMAVATSYGAGGPFVVARKFIVNPSGALTSDTSFGNAGRAEYAAPDDLCLPAARPCRAVARAAVIAGGLLQVGVTPSVYVVGSVNYDGTDNWDAFVLNFSGTSGAAINSFHDDGWREVFFDQADSDFADLGVGLSVVRSLGAGGGTIQTRLYVAAEVDRRCFGGIGVAKLDGAGDYVTAFGMGGKAVFGGSGASICPSFGARADVPHDMARNGNRLGIAGWGTSINLGGTAATTPMLAIVDTETGDVEDLARHPVERPDGTRWGDGQLFGIVGSTDGSFSVAGHARDASTTNRLMFVTGRFVGDDTIFADGFD